VSVCPCAWEVLFVRVRGRSCSDSESLFHNIARHARDTLSRALRVIFTNHVCALMESALKRADTHRSCTLPSPLHGAVGACQAACLASLFCVRVSLLERERERETGESGGGGWENERRVVCKKKGKGGGRRRATATHSHVRRACVCVRVCARNEVAARSRHSSTPAPQHLAPTAPHPQRPPAPHTSQQRLMARPIAAGTGQHGRSGPHPLTTARMHARAPHAHTKGGGGHKEAVGHAPLPFFLGLVF
jgi:hypothetical protein